LAEKHLINDDNIEDRWNVIVNVCALFDFSPRDIEHFFRIFSQYLGVDTKEKKAIDDLIDIATLLIALSIRDEAMYYKVGNGDVKPEELVRKS